jgi:hypothetical protein
MASATPPGREHPSRIGIREKGDSLVLFVRPTRTNVFLPPSRRFIVLVAVVDRAGRGGTRKVKGAFESVERRYAELGHVLRQPVSAEIVAIAIMGASKSLSDRHTLYVSVRAVESGLLDGLIAHEMGHMLRTEEGHPSHSPEVFRLITKEVRIPRAAEGAFGQAFNHIQDVYADDLAFPVFAGADGGRAYEFFAAWVENNTSMRGKNRWQNLGLAASNGFAIGNLVRHDLIASDDKLWDPARAFDREAGFQAVDALAEFYAELPDNPSSDGFIAQVKRLAETMTKASTT